MLRLRDVAFVLFLLVLTTGSNALSVLSAEEEAGICLGQDIWCAETCMSNDPARRSCAAICADKCSHHSPDPGAPIPSDGCGNSDIDLCGPNHLDWAKITRTCRCKDYCENNQCEPGSGYTRDECSAGRKKSLFRDKCGCWSCVADCDSCSYEANGPEECAEDGGYYNEDCGCCVSPWSPIVIALRGEPDVSDMAHGVFFDFWAKAKLQRVPWPVGNDTAWLVFDRNANGQIDSGHELFGNVTIRSNGVRARNGFVALTDFDSNSDGRIDAQDVGFSQLKLWYDRDRSATSKPDELIDLSRAGIVSISLDYRESRHSDRSGNVLRYRSQVHLEGGQTRWAYDVYLNHDDGGQAKR